MLKTKEARRAQGMIGSPNKKDYKVMVSGNLITNCPVTTANINNAHAIFNPDLANIRGKTVQQTPTLVEADYVAVPCSLVESNKVVTMTADVFFVDGTPFLLTMSRRIKFITVEHVSIRTAKSLSKYVDQVLQVYRQTGFNARPVLMDGEFLET
jgi:hypothetical protein